MERRTRRHLRHRLPASPVIRIGGSHPLQWPGRAKPCARSVCKCRMAHETADGACRRSMSTWRRTLLSGGRGTPARGVRPRLARRRSSERLFRRGFPRARNAHSPSEMSMKQELAAMIALAERLLASNTPGTLATLFAARGSTYRSLGSMMVSLPGMHAGGVSGGCLEEYVARAGERATRNTPTVMLRFSTHPDSDDDTPVLGCGGSIDLLVERLTPDHVTLLEQLASASERDECSLLACVVKRGGQSLSVTREWLRQAEGSCSVMPELACICGDVTREARSHH